MPHGVLAKLASASGQLGPLPQGSGNPTPHDAKTPSERVDYSMRISRLTVDKLGVKLYDKVSAVIAELIANAYDADAIEVTVHAPMGKYLATPAGVDGNISDKGFTIEVVDNGIGMTPQQMQKFFLVVGAERRKDSERGDKSPVFGRKVMGRKGVGKLAPFGICKTIEVISAGGELITDDGKEPSTSGYRTSHILLHYDNILKSGNEPDEHYKPTVGDKDGLLFESRGTKIVLKHFNYRKVPDIKTLDRQLAQRFGLESEDWKIQLLDNTNYGSLPTIVGKFPIEPMLDTKITFQSNSDNSKNSILYPDGRVELNRAGFDYNSIFYEVSGWMAYSKSPYIDELMAGVRIYCRGKIAAQTSIFNQRAGFTGEHNIRSYLIGELHADWLDEDEDLIQTDRRDILWSDERAAEFEVWGQKMVKQMGTLSRNPMRKQALQLFLETAGDVNARIHKAYPAEEHASIREEAQQLAESLGRKISHENAKNTAIVNELIDLSIDFAPHLSLTSMMKKAIDDADRTLSALALFLRTARIAELSSFGQIAKERLKVLDRLEFLKDADNTNEDELQKLIANAPWLINPEWAPITANQSFSRLGKEFQKYYNRKRGENKPISLSFQEPGKRPDFVLSNQEGKVQIIEIKKPHHKLTNLELDRIVTYYDNMDEFLKSLTDDEFCTYFTGFHITLVCDDLALTGVHRTAFEKYKNEGALTRMSWKAFLLKTEQVHQDFLREAQRQRDAMPSVPQDG